MLAFPRWHSGKKSTYYGGLEMSRRLKVVLVGTAIGALTLAYPSVAMAADADVCEFPAQEVHLERQVNITNPEPQLINEETDLCGNVVGYTETMTKHATTGPWVPASGANSF